MRGRPLAVAVGLLQTTRVPTALLIGLAVWLPAVSADIGPGTAAGAAAVFALAAMAGFALNDYSDVGRDLVNHPHRAIPSGRLSPSLALVAAIALLLIAAAAAAYVSTDPVQACLFALTLGGVLSYNAVTVRAPHLKTLHAAALSSMPVLYVILVHDYEPVYYLVPVASLLFLVGRELLMDVRDLRGDRLAGLVTLPMRLGDTRTTGIAFLLEFSAALLLLPLVLWTPTIRNALCLTAIVLAVIAASVTWSSGQPGSRRLTIYLLWLPLLAGIAMLVRPPG